MALTGLQIQKLLPKTNCKECGSNTCLAFAMKLAAKKADLSACPYASEEAKQVLGAASEPPVKEIKLGSDGSLKLGGETVLYRHEKTFVNQTALVVNISDSSDEATINHTLRAIAEYSLERVGEVLTIDMICLSQESKDSKSFLSLVKKAKEVTGKPLVVKSNEVDVLAEAAPLLKGTGGVLAPVTAESVDRLLPVAREYGLALAVTAADLDRLVSLSNTLRDADFHDFMLQFPAATPAEHFQMNSIARRAALKDSVKALGYPSIRFIPATDGPGETAAAINDICKYGGICVLPSFDQAQLVSLMTLRLNVYTDPQKPIQVEPKVYPVGEPDDGSPVFLTTNFSLTYFIVSGEIENSGISAWLVVPECEGMSVLTAWAAGKFSGAVVAKFIKDINLEEKVKSRLIVIPGYVAQISGELEENLPGWQVLVGPQEAADIESFVKNRLL